MVMRYHWGLAPGHVYSQGEDTIVGLRASDAEDVIDDESDDAGDDWSPNVSEGVHTEIHNKEHPDESDNSSRSGSDSSGDSEGSNEEAHGDELELMAVDEMYGDSQDLDLYE